MTHAYDRRWSFSLRTLFVVVAVVAAWLAYEVNWIRQRQVVIGNPSVKSSDYYIEESQPISGPAIRRIGHEVAPWPLRWLGEAAYSNILLKMGTSEDELARVRRIFPDARVEVDKP